MTQMQTGYISQKRMIQKVKPEAQRIKLRVLKTHAKQEDSARFYIWNSVMEQRLLCMSFSFVNKCLECLSHCTVCWIYEEKITFSSS